MILSGTLPDQSARVQILNRARDVYGEGQFTDALRVTSQSAFPTSRWLYIVLATINLANRLHDDGSISLEAKTMVIRGTVESEEAKMRLINDATGIAGSIHVEDKIIVKSKAHPKKEGN